MILQDKISMFSPLRVSSEFFSSTKPAILFNLPSEDSNNSQEKIFCPHFYYSEASICSDESRVELKRFNYIKCIHGKRSFIPYNVAPHYAQGEMRDGTTRSTCFDDIKIYCIAGLFKTMLVDKRYVFLLSSYCSHIYHLGALLMYAALFGPYRIDKENKFHHE